MADLSPAESSSSPRPSNALNRRDLLKTGLAAGAVLGLGSAAGCGSSSSSNATATPTSAGKPKRGGTLTAGLIGGGSSDTLDGQDGIENCDFARILSLYDPLVGWSNELRPQLKLAESITPNSNASEWTIELRKGVEFHNGKDVVADDVIYSLQRVANPKKPLPAASSIALVDTANLKAVDDHTVKVPCKSPFATFIETIVGVFNYLSIVPVGYDPKKPVGTGPFKYEKFAPGVQSTFVRNPNYWQTGLPYLDTLVITDYSDETSQVNGLLSGAVDVVNLLSAASIGTVQASANVLVSDGGGFTPFTMRVDLAPFSDPNLRKALRLLVDRPQMIHQVFGGHGKLGNDIFSPYDSFYDTSIPQRVQDYDQAKFYLKKAGLSGGQITLTTSGIAQGTVEAATVLAQQAQGANLTINLNRVTVTDFYGPNYLKWPFAQDYWYFSDYLPQVAQATLPSSPFNETHWNDPQYNKLYAQAIRTLDDSLRKDIAHEMQMIDYERGGYIIPYFPPVIDGYARHVHGAVPVNTGYSLSNYGFGHMWLD